MNRHSAFCISTPKNIFNLMQETILCFAIQSILMVQNFRFDGHLSLPSEGAVCKLYIMIAFGTFHVNPRLHYTEVE